MYIFSAQTESPAVKNFDEHSTRIKMALTNYKEEEGYLIKILAIF